MRYQKEQEEKEKNQGGFWGGLGYVFEKIGLGFLQSIEGIWDYTAGGLADLFGAHDWAEKQIANDWVNYNHADEWFNPSDGWKVAGDVAGGIGTSLPALGAVAAAAAIAFFSGGTLVPVSAGLIGGVVAGLGAAGTATKEAYRETGELNGATWGYGTLSGFTEGVMEGVSDVIGFGVGSIAKNLAKSTAKEGAKQVGKQIAKSAARQTFGKAILSSFLSEAFEEGVQELLDPVWKRVTYDPNAKNATFQEVAYAALIGGLSGAIMGGADVSVRNSINYFSGSKINGNGGAKGVIDLATTIAETEGVNQSGNAQVDFVVNTLNELQESLQKTNGEVKTAKQKMLVGILSKANTAAPLSIVVSQNADAIVHDAETTVKRLNDIGYKTSDGAEVTVEMLTKGVTGERGTREYRRSLSDAMRTNEALRTVAVMSAAGQLNMDAARFQESTLRGEQLATQADLNHFIETATEAQKRDVGERLGITDWATVTADELKSRVREFSENGGVDQYINERNEVKKLSELEISKKGLPKYVGSITQDGAVRYKFGDASVAIVKNGDTYRVYDYARDVISKPLSKKEANRVIKEIYAASTVSETSSDTQNTAENTSDSQKQTQEIDTFARDHVPDYKKITGAQQQAVRQTLRQARAANVSEADQILYASVAARSGANIEFVSAEALGANADAGYSMKDGKILVNRDIANNPKARTAARILLHEFTHAMINRGYSVKGKKGKQHIENKVLNDFFTTAIKGLSAEQQLQILTPYIERHGVKVQDFIDGKVDISLDTYIELREELAAHFVERELGNSAALKRIISDKPTFKDKLLAFLKRAKSDYGTTNEKMSRAANALLKKYQTFFNRYATQTRFSPSIDSDVSAHRKAEEGQGSNPRHYALSRSFAEQIDDVLAGKHDPNYDLFVSETPQVLRSIGFENKPLLMRNSKVKEILAKHPEMSVELIKQIPQAIADPVMIIKSKTNPTESVVAITDIKTSNGEMIIPVWINQDGTYLDVELGNSIRLNTNFVASAYGRSIKALLSYAIDNNEVLFYAKDKKRVSTLLATHGLQLPARLSTTNFTTIVPENSVNVKPDGVNFKTFFNLFKGYIFVGFMDSAFFAKLFWAERRTAFKRPCVCSPADCDRLHVLARYFVINPAKGLNKSALPVVVKG